MSSSIPPFPLIPSNDSLKHRSFIFPFKNAALSKIMWNSGKISLKNLSFVSLIFLLIFPIISSTSFQRRHHQRQHWDWTASDDQSVDEVNSKEAEQRKGGRIPTKSSAPQNHRKMNAAGFFYISADFPMESEQRPPHDDLANEDCSMYPNGTFKAPYAFTCSDPQNGPPLFVVHDTALANRSARYEYPLDLRDASPMLRVFMDLTSFATRSFESMRAEVALLRRKVGWLGCGWMPIPTFGAFDSMDICEDNDSCPIFPGRQVLELRLEPSNMFLAMLRFMLQDEKPPYELRIRLINNRSHGEELLCVVFQTRLIF